MIHFREQAVADIESHANFMSLDSVDAAIRFARAVRASASLLHDSPKIGRPRRFQRPDLREVRSWPVDGFANYLIFFSVADDGSLVVLRVLHGARQIRATLFERSP